MTEYYVDDQGNYIGGFDGSTPPEGSIEVSAPPSVHAWQKWDFENEVWLPLTQEQQIELGLISD